METKTPGILLQCIPYLGKKHILKVFTLEEGLVSLMAKSTHSSALTSPFCIAEWVYEKRQSELCSLKDGSVVEALLSLRQRYDTLTAAGSIAKDLILSQLPFKRNSDLYHLAAAYLQKLPTFAHPEILAASFRLKLLLHEGLLSLQEQCCQCELPARHLFQGESYCLNHGPTPGTSFEEEEWQQLIVLGFARQFSLLQNLNLVPKEKIEILLKERLAH